MSDLPVLVDCLPNKGDEVPLRQLVFLIAELVLDPLGVEVGEEDLVDQDPGRHEVEHGDTPASDQEEADVEHQFSCVEWTAHHVEPVAARNHVIHVIRTLLLC